PALASSHATQMQRPCIGACRAFSAELIRARNCSGKQSGRQVLLLQSCARFSRLDRSIPSAFASTPANVSLLRATNVGSFPNTRSATRKNISTRVPSRAEKVRRRHPHTHKRRRYVAGARRFRVVAPTRDRDRNKLYQRSPEFPRVA